MPPAADSLNLFTEACIAEGMTSFFLYPALKKIVDVTQPSMIFHVASQALVRRAYYAPLLSIRESLMLTVEWAKAYDEHPQEATKLLKHQILTYQELSCEKN